MNSSPLPQPEFYFALKDLYELLEKPWIRRMPLKSKFPNFFQGTYNRYGDCNRACFQLQNTIFSESPLLVMHFYYQ